MKIWMSPQTEKRNPSWVRFAAAVAGLVLLALLLVMGGLELVRRLHLPLQTSLLALCLLITVLLVFLAYRLGRRNARNLTAFFLDEQDRLFAVDLRWLLPRGRGTYHDWKQLQQWADRIRAGQVLPAEAVEILRVESLRENPGDYALVCQVRRHGRIGKRTLMLMKGYEDEDWLVRELERRRSWDSNLAEDSDRRPVLPAAGALVLGTGVLGAVFSHPALGRFPQNIYFPCLAVALAGIVMLAYWIVKQHRGE